jgi:hypothetical protein
MAADYPDAITSFPTYVDNVDTVAAAHQNRMAEEILAIEVALGSNLANVIKPGEVRMWAGDIATIPSGWLHCDGSAVSRNVYADLFAVISTDYGSGDGSTTFNVPDMDDQFPIAAKQDDSGIAKSNLEGSLNKSGGSATQPPQTGGVPPTGSQGSSPNQTVGGHSHEFVPPYVAVAFIIKT